MEEAVDTNGLGVEGRDGDASVSGPSAPLGLMESYVQRREGWG